MLWGRDTRAKVSPSAVRMAARLLWVPISMARKPSLNGMTRQRYEAASDAASAFAPCGVVTQKYSRGWLYGLRVV